MSASHKLSEEVIVLRLCLEIGAFSQESEGLIFLEAVSVGVGSDFVLGDTN